MRLFGIQIGCRTAGVTVTLLGVLLLIVAEFVSWWSSDDKPVVPPQGPEEGAMEIRENGALFLIGGSADTVIEDYVRLAGGPTAHVVIITHASSVPEEAGNEIADQLRTYGVTQITVMLPDDHDLPADVDAIYIAGGDQNRLVDRLDESGLAQQVRDAVRRGVLAGTSAGAAAAAFVMVAGNTDDWDKDVVDARKVLFAKGLCLRAGIVVDTHFGQRRRQNRMRTAVGMFEGVVGIGLDEDTAVYITGNDCEVFGAGTVWVYTRNGGDDFLSIARNAIERTFTAGQKFKL